ncbi:MAG: tetratricopeptide repeat protein [Gemmatimonadetes bacterium]|nr:tetratricopeptide repeat protein [Gemmatimonadota bacterium]
MNLRLGLILAGSLTIVGGCAASGGSSGGTMPAAATASPGGTALAQGESPRENEMTRTAERSLEQAEEAESPAEATGLYQAAADAAQQAIDADPTNPLPHLQLGLARMGLDDFVGADEAISRAEELRPIYELETEGMRERAWVDKYQEAAPLVNAGDYEGAIALFEQADAIYDGRPEVKAYLGQLYVQVGQYEEGITVLREAREMINSPRIEEMDSATAAAWRDTDAQLPIYITQALMQTEQYGAASQELQSLLATDPDNLTYLRQLAALYVEMEQPEDAKGVYERMAATGNLTGVEHYAIGVGLYTMEDYPAAIESFEAAVDLATNDRDALEMWARSIQLAYPQGEDMPEPPAGALEEMASVAERWLELDPNNRNAYLILAQTSNRLGDEDRARDMVAAIEGLSVMVNNVQLQRFADGGGMVTGAIGNVSLDAGTNVTLEIQFYDAGGAQIGSETTMVALPAPEASQAFSVEFTSSEIIAGYGYTISY